VRNFSPDFECRGSRAGQEDLLDLPLVELLDELAERDVLSRFWKRRREVPDQDPDHDEDHPDSKLFRVEFKPGLTARLSSKSKHACLPAVTRASRAKGVPGHQMIRSWPVHDQRNAIPLRPGTSGPRTDPGASVSPQAHRRQPVAPDAGPDEQLRCPPRRRQPPRSALPATRPGTVAPAGGVTETVQRPPGSVQRARPGRGVRSSQRAAPATRPPVCVAARRGTRAPRSTATHCPGRAWPAAWASRSHRPAPRPRARRDGPPAGRTVRGSAR